MWPTGCSAPGAACVSAGCIGVLMTPGETAFTANAAFGVLDRQRLGGGVEAALGQRRRHGRYAIDGVIDQAGGDLHDVAAAMLFLFRNRQLGEAEEAGEVDAQRAGEIDQVAEEVRNGELEVVLAGSEPPAGLRKSPGPDPGLCIS
jgi:hypothetical protein